MYIPSPAVRLRVRLAPRGGVGFTIPRPRRHRLAPTRGRPGRVQSWGGAGQADCGQSGVAGREAGYPGGIPGESGKIVAVEGGGQPLDRPGEEDLLRDRASIGSDRKATSGRPRRACSCADRSAARYSRRVRRYCLQAPHFYRWPYLRLAIRHSQPGLWLLLPLYSHVKALIPGGGGSCA